MKPRHIILSLIMLPALAQSAGAQSINREITVDREIIPVERDARRLPLLPEVKLPALPAMELAPTQRVVTTAVPPTVRLLDPARWTDPAAAPAARGYAVIAAGGPALNAGVSAGYRIVSKPATSLGAWMQWNSNVYERNDMWWRSHAGTLGVDFAHRFSAVSLLEASAAWAVDRFNMPWGSGYWQTSNRADMNLAWHSRVGGMKYNVKADYGHFAYAASPQKELRGVRQNRFTLGADGWLPTSDASFAGVKVDLDLLSTVRGSTTGIVTLTPQWRLDLERFSLKAGPRIDLTFNGGKAVHVAPDVEIGWRPAGFFAIAARAGGGERLNPLSALAQIAPRQIPYSACGMSHMPLSCGAEITIGPWRGAWLRLYGDWAKVNNAMMPMAAADGGIMWTPENISGGCLGAEIGARLRSFAEITAGYSAAPGRYGKVGLTRYDRARHVASAHLTLRPLPRLRIGVGYELLACRSMAVAGGNGALAPLSNISDLGIDASYRFTERLNFFVNARNLLNRDAELTDLTVQQGVSGSIGASLLF